jgi:hypothetical protein
MTRLSRTKSAAPRKPKGAAAVGVTGEVVIKAMQASPYRNVNIEPKRERMLVRVALQ